MPVKRPLTPEAARLRMADLCARSEQCEHDIRTKLIRLGLASSQIEPIIDFLKENRFIDSLRYAASFARDKCRFSSWGKNKIRVALMVKRLPAADIEAGLREIDGKDYLDALRRVTLSKGRQLDLLGENSREERLKLYRHILSRGFEPALASKAVDSFIKRLRRDSERENSKE